MQSSWEEQRARLYSLLGPLPERHAPYEVVLESREERENCILERLELSLKEETGLFQEPVPMIFLYPKHLDGPVPAVLFCHSHGGRYELGKDELLLGNSYMFQEPYADALIREGWAVLAFDAWCFGQRRKDLHPEYREGNYPVTHTSVTESEVFKDMLWQGEILWGHMVYDGLRAFDYLKSRPETDSRRIASLGMSMGSTLSFWLAALEPGIKVCVDLCCQTDFDALAKENGFDRHGLFYYVPGLRRHFHTADIDCMIAPRPHLSTIGELDPLTPLEGVRRIAKQVNECYQHLKSEGRPADDYQVLYYPVAHQETPEMREDVLRFLRNKL